MLYWKKNQNYWCDERSNSKYVPKEMMREMRNMKHVKHAIWKNSMNVPIELTVINDKKDAIFADRIAFAVEFFSSWFSSLSDAHLRPERVNMTIVLLSVKKQLPSIPKYPLSPINVNSGVTIVENGNVPKALMVFRREECTKVIIHEMLHYFSLDFKDYFEKVRLSETYVETMADILNVMWETMLHDKKLYAKLVDAEIVHASKVANDIARHYGHKCWKDCIDITGLIEIPFEQNTHVYEYYILRALVLKNIEEFLDDWCRLGFVACNVKKRVIFIKKLQSWMSSLTRVSCVHSKKHPAYLKMTHLSRPKE
jgi:hypothetical protein